MMRKYYFVYGLRLWVIATHISYFLFYKELFNDIMCTKNRINSLKFFVLLKLFDKK